MDFVELGVLILENWNVFEDSFPDRNWIKGKIDELGVCRNSIAHNGYIGDYEKRLLSTSYEGILRQIGENNY